MPFDYSNISVDVLKSEIFEENGIVLSILRLDKIHPIVSGNKIFKLAHFLTSAEASNKKIIITFGGPYSNHLSATSFACKQMGLRSIGIVRGEKPLTLSYTLQQCISDGMELKFISRREYDQKNDTLFLNLLRNEYGDCVIIPEGGYATEGVKGAALIMDYIPPQTTHVCCAVGTGTTLSGLLINNPNELKVIGVPVLKGMKDLKERIFHLTENTFDGILEILEDHHFGGYAKKNNELIDFMNEFYKKFNVPTDFVYTAKLMYAIIDQVKKQKFSPGSNIVCIHTGGLQGNRSLPAGMLFF